MTFRKFVEQYVAYKKKKTGSSEISLKERASLRNAYKSMNESSEKSSKKGNSSFEKFVEGYKNYKEKKTGNSKITFKEYKSLKEEFNKTSKLSEKKQSKNDQSKNAQSKNAQFEKFVENYKSYKKQKTGSSKITFKEYKSLKNEFGKVSMKEKTSSKRSKSFEMFVENYKSYKKQHTGESKVSFKEYQNLKIAFKKMMEDVDCDSQKPAQEPEAEEMNEKTKMLIKKKIREANYHLRMAKKAFKENDMMGVEDGLGDATAAVDAAAGMVDGTQPADLTTQIQSVITSVDQLAQAAGLVPQDDMAANVDAGVPAVEGQPVDPNAQMLESNRAKRARNRIENALNEEITVPAEGKVAKGVSKYAGKVWKPASVKYARTGSLTEREDEAMVDELLNEKKLDYKELFSKGILG